MSSENDWREMGQERYLKGISLTWKKYTATPENEDHNHCEFCFKKFMEIVGEDILTEGYASKDNKHWVCKQCFTDFKEEYKWKIT